MKLPAPYVCPISQDPLTVEPTASPGQTLQNGTLHTSDGSRYPVVAGIPHLVPADRALSPHVEDNKQYYESVGAVYDEGMDWLFRSFGEDEAKLREQMIDLLEPTPTARILEVGAGTCRDTIHIAHRLSPLGQLFVTDLSPNMLMVGRHRVQQAGLLSPASVPLEFFVSDAAYLPFPDGYFDAVYHFGGINVFEEKARAFRELTRVVRVGGKVVIGDESVPPWLRGTTFGDILLTSNPLYAHTIPLECIPPCAREVNVRWVLGNSFYLIDYRVGTGLPRLDLDLPIPGRRGGSHRTRYFGRLEGIDPEIKARAVADAEARGVSLRAWMQEAVQSKLAAG